MNSTTISAKELRERLVELEMNIADLQAYKDLSIYLANQLGFETVGKMGEYVDGLKITRDKVTKDAIKAVSKHVLEVQRKTSRDFIIHGDYKITIKDLKNE